MWLAHAHKMKFWQYQPNKYFPRSLTNCLCEYCWPRRGTQNSEWNLKFSLGCVYCREWIQALLELHALRRFLDVKTKKDRVYSHPLWKPYVLLQVCTVCVHTCERREAVPYCAQIMRDICATQTHHEMHTIVCAQIVAARSHLIDGANSNQLWCASHAT